VSMIYRIGTESSRPPRVAHVEVGGTLGGSLVGLSAYLRHCDAGRFEHEVLFFALPPGSDEVLGSRWPITELGFTVPPLSRPGGRESFGWLRTLLTARPRLRKWLTLVRGCWQLLAALPRAIQLARYFRLRRYDLVHCNNSFTYQIPTVLAAWIARKPLVCHFRTIRRLTSWENWLSRKALVIVAVSHTVANELKRQGVRRPIVVCYNPREEPNACPETTAVLRCQLAPDGTALVGTVTRLEDGKGVEDFLAAACLLRSRWPNVHYVIVGGGSKAKAFERLATELGLQPCVHFAGFRSNVIEYYASMDIFVCPSLVEGAQGVVIEAMLMGRPVVATRVGSVEELIRDGDSGLIVAASDPDNLAQAIDSLLANSPLQQAMGARGMASVRHLCDPVSQARMLDEIFARVLSRRSFTNTIPDGMPEQCADQQGSSYN
jgi:glycosyltransferase involved in cell wall biosynthesis